jgi:hypothetical protein
MHSKYTADVQSINRFNLVQHVLLVFLLATLIDDIFVNFPVRTIDKEFVLEQPVYLLSPQAMLIRSESAPVAEIKIPAVFEGLQIEQADEMSGVVHVTGRHFQIVSYDIKAWKIPMISVEENFYADVDSYTTHDY